MVKINLASIKMQAGEYNKFIKFVSSAKAASLLNNAARKIKSESNPLLPSSSGKRYTRAPKLKDSFIITKTALRKMNLKDYGKIEVNTLRIKPKRRQKYYYVVLSGKNSYMIQGQKVKKKLNYKNNSARPFAIENIARKESKVLLTKTINAFLEEVRKTN